MEGEAEWRVETPWPGSVKLLAEEGAWRHLLADLNDFWCRMYFEIRKSGVQVIISLWEGQMRNMGIWVDKLRTENYHLTIGKKHLKTEADHLKALLTSADHRQNCCWRNNLLFQIGGSAIQYFIQTLRLGMGIFGMIVMIMRPQRTLTLSLMRVTMRSLLLCTLFPSLWQSWQNCRRIYSRKPENSAVEIMFIQTPDSLGNNGNIEGDPCDYKPGENDYLSP